MSKYKSKLLYIVHFSVITLFFIFIFGMSAMHILTQDNEYSFLERRSLAEIPFSDLNLIRNGEVSESIEKYLLDHFPYRDLFRSIKAGTDLLLLHRSDINGIYSHQGSLFKTEYPLRKNKVEQAAELIESLSDDMLADLNSFYAVIPDKSFYISEDKKHPQLDQNRIEALMNNTIQASTMLALSSELSAGHYYKTDLHWDQSRLPDIASFLADKMGRDSIGELSDYEANIYSPFLGAWYGRWAVGHETDTLTWLSNELIETAEVYDHYDGSIHNVYELDALQRPDAYDIFLNGTRPLLTITAEREVSGSPSKLYLFRDSFGSSLAPLMLAYYDEIVLIDLRYVSAAALDELIEITPGADALFLLSTMTINNSDMLKN